MKRLLLAVMLLATPAVAQESQVDQRIARLEQQVQQLQQKVDELSHQSKPVVQGMREKFDEQRPALEATGRSVWEKIKSAAAVLADDIRELFNKKG